MVVHAVVEAAPLGVAGIEGFSGQFAGFRASPGFGGEAM